MQKRERSTRNGLIIAASIEPQAERHTDMTTENQPAEGAGEGGELKTEFYGFACPMDGTGCQPVTKELAEALWAAAEEADRARSRLIHD